MSELLQHPQAAPTQAPGGVGVHHWHAVADVARLLGVSERHVRRMCGTQWHQAGFAMAPEIHAGGRKDWLISSAADPRLVIAPSQVGQVASQLAPKLLEKATRRLGLVKRWEQKIEACKQLGEGVKAATARLMTELALEKKQAAEKGLAWENVSPRTLYNWSKAYKSGGLAALTDSRSKRREKLVRDADPFLAYARQLYEHENKRTYAWCHQRAMWKADDLGWAKYSYIATKRYLQSLKPAELIARREGDKAFNDKCTPNIRRSYFELRSNEVWVADHHQFDVLVKVGERLNAKTGELEPIFARPWLTAWMDCRSRKLVAWEIRVTDPATDVIIRTWRAGCLSHGVPEVAYTDNGKDFDAQVFTGITKKQRAKLFASRKLRVDHDQVKLGGIYAGLGVEHMHAWKYHGQSKPIERFFKTTCIQFAVEFETYCGNSPDNRPEGLADRLERGLAPELRDFIAHFGDWLDVYHANPHRGDGMEEFAAKGFGPAKAWESCLVTKRTADPQLLDLLCQPRIGPLPVGADGVTHLGIQYGRGQITATHFGREVCIRLRGDDVSSVTVWSVDDREFLGIADANGEVPFRATIQEQRSAIQEKRSDARKLRESFLPSLRRHETVADRMNRARQDAARAAATPPKSPEPPSDPYVLQPVRSDLEMHLKALQDAEEIRDLRKAAGAESMGGRGGGSIQDALAAYGASDD